MAGRALLYIALALAFLMLVATLVISGAAFRFQTPIRWVGLIAYTPAIFWAAARPFKRDWHRAKFWLAVFGLLTIHALSFIWLLRMYPAWPLIWFMPLSVAEAVLIGLVLSLLFDPQ